MIVLIITLDEAKQWLRVEHSDEDGLISTLINAAEKYLFNATGNTFDSTNELAKLFCYVLVTDWYENREMIGKTSEKVRHT
ncbi:head-tail connector protein, partial [Geobacillus sp. FJAT-46040]|uniref:head-tail connector protein n=1 Tax=Geobacillus sp. FJAT-46040 TaxID=2011017 RepID=UPI00350F8571